MNERRAVRIVIGLAITAALVRLAPLGWLHPLNWDEIEFYRATKWIAEGRLPFRDFWEHHTPLPWFVFAPVAAMTDSPGADAILTMRWAQIPVWIAIFFLANVLMRDLGLSRFARWAAMALALSSSLLMIPAVEYRVDPLAILLFLGGLCLEERRHSRRSSPGGDAAGGQSGGYAAALPSGALLCLTAFANIRFGPVLVATLVLLAIRDWRPALRIAAGGAATLALVLAFFGVTGSLAPFYRQVVVENALGDKLGPAVEGGFVHRLLVPFGVRVIGSDRWFELAAFDVGGASILVLGFTGIVVTLLRWRERRGLLLIAILQLVNLLVIARMDLIYNYHFELVAILMLPLIAATFERVPRPAFILALLAVTWYVNAFASFFRGKELDLAYQDFVMREVDARTRPDEVVFAGIPWALRREPAYRFWFLPDLARLLVQAREAPRYVPREPPAAIVFDHQALRWLGMAQRELAPHFVRHYIPVWRNVWVPALNVRLQATRSRFEWIVPRDGRYRLFASPELAKHRWFRDPFYVAWHDRPHEQSFTLALRPPAPHPQLRWMIDRQPATFDTTIELRQMQRVTVTYDGGEPLGVILLPGDDRVLFRNPPPGATLEAAATRVTHWPNFGVKVEK